MFRSVSDVLEETVHKAARNAGASERRRLVEGGAPGLVRVPAPPPRVSPAPS